MSGRVAGLVDRGFALRNRIAALQEELEQIEGYLIEAAKEGEQVLLADEDREGRQFLATGSEVVVPVVFTADKITASFKNRGALHDRILNLIGGKITQFYAPVTTWEMLAAGGKVFRRKADELLGKDGPALVTACLARDKHGIPKSDIKIEWKRAEGIKV
jgi:hypothetical protein